MSQVVAYTNRIELKTLLEIECNSIKDVAIAIHNDVEEFKGLLDIFEEVEIVVVDDPLPELIIFLKKNSFKIKNILILAPDKIDISQAKIFSLDGIEELFTHLRLLFGRDDSKNDDFISIPLGSLIHFTSLPIDIYLKLSDSRYLKCIKANDEIDVETILKLEEKGVQFIYFEKKNNRELSTMLLNNMIKKVEKEYVTIGEKLKANNEVYHTTREIVSKMGLPSKIMDVAESVVSRITDETKKEQTAISSYLNQLRTNNDLGFRYRFAEISSFLATKIVQEMPDSNIEHVRKVVYACLFSDVSLSDRSHIHIRNSEDLSKLSLAQQKEISQHAFTAAELIAQSRHAPLEVDKLIRQHHGSITGFGFQKEISVRLSPFSLCVITAQEVAYGILMEPNKKMAGILLDGKKHFNSNLLDKYFELLEKDLFLE
jgi:hypothetical protein